MAHLSVADVLSADAPDTDIAAFAASNDWVVFTNDDDFYGPDIAHGLVVYSQVEDPRPGGVVEAIAAIDEAYAVASDVTEFVPDGWV